MDNKGKLFVTLFAIVSRPSTGTGKKRGIATQTAPNQTAGPLAVISDHDKLGKPYS